MRRWTARIELIAAPDLSETLNRAWKDTLDPHVDAAVRLRELVSGLLEAVRVIEVSHTVTEAVPDAVARDVIQAVFEDGVGDHVEPMITDEAVDA